MNFGLLFFLSKTKLFLAMVHAAEGFGFFILKCKNIKFWLNLSTCVFLLLSLQLRNFSHNFLNSLGLFMIIGLDASYNELFINEKFDQFW